MSERRSRRRSPVPALVVLALIPAIGLVVLWRWADDQAAAPATTSTTTTTTVALEPVLTTPLLSMRRLPEPVAEWAGDTARAAALGSVTASVDDTSCLAVDAGDGLRASAHGSLPLIPASNQKLLVAAVALALLGPDHRYVTEARGAPIVDGILAGNLYLVGGGDPLLATADVPDPHPHPAFNTTPFEALADQLVAAGLRRVEGDIVGDGSRYDDELVVPSWGDDITRADAGPYDALMVDDGRLVGSGIGLNPNQSAASELNRLLIARGVSIGGRNRADVTPTEGVGVLASIEGAPLQGVLEELLQTSDNNTAELVLKELGVASSGVGSRAAGLAAVTAQLTDWGVPTAGLVLDDGSGLSRVNRLTCDALRSLLADTPVADDLVAALPTAGETGTLEDQLVGTAAQGRLHAKTGTLTDVKALSGRLDGTGEVLTFAWISNTPGADDPAWYLPQWQTVIDVPSALPVGPSVDELSPR